MSILLSLLYWYISFCSSGGIDTFSKMNLVSANPYSSKVGVSFSLQKSDISPRLAENFSTPKLLLANSSVILVTMRLRSCPPISSVENSLFVPTISSINFLASVTRKAYVPKARMSTIPNFSSFSIMGFLVPHFWSVYWRVFTK